MNTTEGNVIEITISHHVGNKVKYDYDNDGGRTKLETPYRQKWSSAKFKLPTGKKKNEIFHHSTDDEILQLVSRKYSNFKFTLAIPSPLTN